MDTDIEHILENNEDVIGFIADLMEGEPDMSARDMKIEIYRKFGIKRFNRKSLILSILMCAGKNKNSV